MKRKISLVAILLAAVFALGSCSGVNSVPCTDCGPSGNAKLSITLLDAPPVGVSVLSLTMPIIGISLTPSTGSVVPVYSPSAPAQFELTRLQTDSSLIINAASVPTGTYTAVNVTVGPAQGVYINASNTAFGSCAAGAACDLIPGAATTIIVPISLTLNANQNQWLGLDLQLVNAIVSTNSGVQIDFTQANVMSAVTTSTGNPTNVFDTIEDFVGTVSAISGSSITVKSGTTPATMTAAINANTTYDDPQGLCNGGLVLTCLQNSPTHGVVSIDVYLNSDGTLSASEIDVIDVTPIQDEVEGIIYPLCQGCSQYGMILSDKTVFSGNAALTAAALGSGIFIALDGNPTFAVDTKTLTPSLSHPSGFSSGSDVLTGQVVRARLDSAAAASGGGVNAVASSFLLRFSRLTGLVNTVTPPLFTANSLPSYLTFYGGNLSPTPQIQTYSPGTVYQGITQLTDLQPNNSISIRTLYLNVPSTYPFITTKVRKH